MEPRSIHSTIILYIKDHLKLLEIFLQMLVGNFCQGINISYRNTILYFYTIIKSKRDILFKKALQKSFSVAVQPK